jgi:hypothetical protein
VFGFANIQIPIYDLLIICGENKTIYFLLNEIQVALCQRYSKGPCLWVLSHHVQKVNCNKNKLIPINKQ